MSSAHGADNSAGRPDLFQGAGETELFACLIRAAAASGGCEYRIQVAPKSVAPPHGLYANASPRRVVSGRGVADRT
ncbi:hypothetical protein MRX96_035563 [Rhipicephalus microplus]